MITAIRPEVEPSEGLEDRLFLKIYYTEVPTSTKIQILVCNVVHDHRQILDLNTTAFGIYNWIAINCQNT